MRVRGVVEGLVSSVCSSRLHRVAGAGAWVPRGTRGRRRRGRDEAPFSNFTYAFQQHTLTHSHTNRRHGHRHRNRHGRAVRYARAAPPHLARPAGTLATQATASPWTSRAAPQRSSSRTSPRRASAGTRSRTPRVSRTPASLAQSCFFRTLCPSRTYSASSVMSTLFCCGG